MSILESGKKKSWVPTMIGAVLLLCGIAFHRVPFPIQIEDDLRDALNSINGDVKGVLQDDGSVPPITESAPVETAEDKSAVSGLKLHFVNVFQGDAIYIELPGGKTALIDAGPAPDPESEYKTPIVSSFLKKRGVAKIDHLVMTHPHADHYGGLKWVFEELQVDHFYDTRIDNSDADGDNLAREQAKKEPGCVVHYPAEGDQLDWAQGVKVKVLHSCPNRGRSADHRPDVGAFLNNCSIVLKLSYQGSSALLMADAQEEVEARLVQTYGRGLQSDVLKVGHHGSKYSTTEAFLKKVKPEAAFIEVGKYNDFGHPTPDVLARLKAAGAKIHRTDKEGTIEYAMKAPRPSAKLFFGSIFSAD
ncbi:MAG TPA: hypothetical protein DCM05_09640 [Elusimicrobia bacterium]|nr:hypothetical protein [Elusimicrobiota bacterium]